MRKLITAAASVALLLGAAACSHDMGSSGSSTPAATSGSSTPYGAATNTGAVPGDQPYHSPTVTDMTGHTEMSPGENTSKTGTTTQSLGVKAPGAPNASGQ